MSALTNYRYPPRLISVPNHAPVAADSAAGREDVRSTTEGGKQEANGGKLAFIRAVQAFSCHGCLLARPALQFYFSSFYVTHRFFVTFFPEESNVSFVPLCPFAPQLLIRVSSTFRRERMRFSSREM